MKMAHQIVKCDFSSKFRVFKTIKLNKKIQTHIYRLPQEETFRQNWIIAIENHQKHFDRTARQFNVCQLHFHPDHFKTYAKTAKLIKGHSPTIFPVMYVECLGRK